MIKISRYKALGEPPRISVRRDLTATPLPQLSVQHPRRSNRGTIQYDSAQHGTYLPKRERIEHYIATASAMAMGMGYTTTAIVEPRQDGIKSVGLHTCTASNGVLVCLSLGTTASSPNIYVIIPTSETVRTSIETTLRDGGYQLGSTERRSNPALSIKIRDKQSINTVLSEYFDLIQVIDSMGSNFIPPSAARGSRRLNRHMTVQNYYLGAASSLGVAARFGMTHLLSRGGKDGGSGTFDINDGLITVGITARAHAVKCGISNETLYREHVVPCKVIVDRAVEMFKAANYRISLPLLMSIAEMIKQNLFIVLCTADEAKVMDNELKMRDTMPIGWNFGDDPLQRFVDAGIPVYSLDNGAQRLA